MQFIESENEVNVFQRKMIKRIFSIKWEDKITNTELYRRYKLKPWSQTIKGRRLRWYGHLLRLPEETPARKALAEAKRRVKKPRGGQKPTWLRIIKNDMMMAIPTEGKSAKEEQILVLAQNRKEWRDMVHCAMLEPSDGKRN